MVEVFNPSNILEVTKAAAEHFEKHIEKNGEHVGIFIGTKTMGCSGLAYDIDFVVTVPSDITEVTQHGLRFFVSNKAMDFLSGIRIDYVQHEFGLYKLEYSNPHESARCGCGESFTV